MLWVETKKLARLPGTLVAAGLSAAFVALGYSQTSQFVGHGFGSEAMLSPSRSVTYSLALLASVGPMLSTVVGTVLSGHEFSYRTWSLLLTHGASRGKIWTTKMVALLVVLTGLVTATVLTGYASSLFWSGHMGLPTVDVRIASQAGAVFFALDLWAIVGFTGSLLFQSTAAGLAAGIGLPIFEMMFLQQAPVSRWLPVWNQRALYVSVFGEGQMGMITFFPGDAYPSGHVAALTLVVIMGVVLAASYVIVQRTRAA